MRRDHPLVLLCYFGTVLVLSMLTMHPLWIGTAFVSGCVVSGALSGRQIPHCHRLACSDKAAAGTGALCPGSGAAEPSDFSQWGHASAVFPG